MRKPLKVTVVTVMVLATIGFAGSASGILADLAGHWAAPIVGALEAKGIIAGDLQGRFSPESALNRAQMAKLLATGLGREAEANLLGRVDSRFNDVQSWHWAKGYIEAIAELGVTDGYPDGSFGPADTVTRAQMAVFLVRAAGLTDVARLKQFEATSYNDDREIPSWARGAVHLALAYGWMEGFHDGTFRPMQPITKAEGSVAIFRLMERKGMAYHLAGTLVRFDAATLEAVVRDELGQERSVAMAWNASYYRNGVSVSQSAVRALDQVWVVLNAEGKGMFLEARYADLLGTDAVVSGDSLTITLSTGSTRTFTVQPGAMILLNGRPAPLASVHRAPEIYVALDLVTQEVRVLDAVNAPVRGEFVHLDEAKGLLWYATEVEVISVPVTQNAVFLLNNDRARPADFTPGDRLRVALNEAGAVTYVQAER